MERTAFTAALFLGAILTWGQNLVPNGSFEEIVTCPTGWGQWYQAVGWTSPYTASADYFNACTGDNTAGVPYNQFGYQWAADGQAYVGMVTYKADNPMYREFMSVQLPEPLQVGTPVCLSFKMAMGGFGSLGFVNSAIYTAKGVGLKFFVDLPTNWPTYLYSNSAALYLDIVPTDTAIWYDVSGSYVPDSAYKYLVVGNFFADTLCSAFQFDTVGHGNWNVAYAFIDDVRVSFDLNYCDYYTGVINPSVRGPIVYPNPFQDDIHVEFGSTRRGAWSVELFSDTGELIRKWMGMSTAMSLSTSTIPAGVYYLRLTDPSGVSHSSALVHLNH